MRVLRLFPFTLLFCVPMLAQSTRPATSDPQAVALVQAAITAMGGATAISQLQSWTFQAEAEGRIANGNKTESLTSSAVNAGTGIPSSNTKTPYWLRPRSLFVPALVGPILLAQSENPAFSLDL